MQAALSQENQLLGSGKLRLFRCRFCLVGLAGILNFMFVWLQYRFLSGPVSSKLTSTARQQEIERSRWSLLCVEMWWILCNFPKASTQFDLTSPHSSPLATFRIRACAFWWETRGSLWYPFGCFYKLPFLFKDQIQHAKAPPGFVVIKRCHVLRDVVFQPWSWSWSCGEIWQHLSRFGFSTYWASGMWVHRLGLAGWDALQKVYHSL